MTILFQRVHWLLKCNKAYCSGLLPFLSWSDFPFSVADSAFSSTIWDALVPHQSDVLHSSISVWMKLCPWFFIQVVCQVESCHFCRRCKGSQKSFISFVSCMLSKSWSGVMLNSWSSFNINASLVKFAYGLFSIIYALGIVFGLERLQHWHSQLLRYKPNIPPRTGWPALSMLYLPQVSSPGKTA